MLALSFWVSLRLPLVFWLFKELGFPLFYGDFDVFYDILCQRITNYKNKIIEFKKELKMNKKLERAYYDILEVKKDADAKEIKRAFKKAAL